MITGLFKGVLLLKKQHIHFKLSAMAWTLYMRRRKTNARYPNSCVEAEFLDEIQTKVLRVFILAIHSHLYSFALRFIFLQTHTTSYSFYSSVTVHCKR
jgi:hypothetical protein